MLLEPPSYSSLQTKRMHLKEFVSADDNLKDLLHKLKMYMDSLSALREEKKLKYLKYIEKILSIHPDTAVASRSLGRALKDINHTQGFFRVDGSLHSLSYKRKH